MIKSAIEKILELSEVKQFNIDGENYSTKGLVHIPKVEYRPKSVGIKSISGVVELLKKEHEKIKEDLIIIEVYGAGEATVYTTYGDKYKRNTLYNVSADLPRYDWGSFISHERFMIELRSKYIENSDVQYLMSLLASISDTNVVKTNDNGVTQSVEVKQGIAMVGSVNLKPIVTLKPYRTFLEIEQPESEFLLRAKEGGQFTLIEADGGFWKIKAKKSIIEYLEIGLAELIESGRVLII